MPRFEPTQLTTLSLTDLPNGTYPAAEIVTGSRGWYRYATAYKEAADSLVGTMDTTYRRNMFGPPMLFLYRHSIELHLKSLLLEAGELLDDPQTIERRHYLWRLWTSVRTMLLRIDNREDEWLLRADDIIKQFDELDRESFAFRYPVRPDGAPSLSDEMLIDPAVVSQIMAELHILLNGASAQIDAYQGYKQDGYGYGY